MTQNRILIVEDETIVAMEIESRLVKLGYRVAGVVGTGEAALLEAEKGATDLVLMDIRLAGDMDGIAAAEQVRSRFHLPVVYLTAYADEQTLQRAKLSEPYGYIVKPFEEADLRSAIEITLYKHAIERRLEESEIRYRTLFERAEDAIFIVEAEGERAGLIVDANQAAAAMHGYTVDELRGSPIAGLDAPGDATQSQGLIARVAGGAWIHQELCHRRKDGSTFTVEISASLITLGGRPLVLAIVRDVSERKRAERALQLALKTAQNEKMKSDAILAAIGDGVSIQDTGFRVLYQNQVHKAMIGDHLGEYCYRAYERLERVCDGCPVELGFKDGNIHTAERVGITDHGVVNVEVTASPIRDAAGTIVAGIEIARNITARKEAERDRQLLIQNLQSALEQVSRSEQEWRKTFDSITDMITIHDEHYTMVKVNAAFARHFNVDRDEVINKKCFEVFHGLDAPVAGCPHGRALDTMHPVTEEVPDPKSGKVFRETVYPYVLTESGGRGSIHVARDITEEREQKMRLIMSERLASLGQMASGIAHEINNPLAAISGCTEGLQRRVRENRYDPAFFQHYLKIIEEEVDRCKTITTGMLSFVKQSIYENRIFNLNEILDRTLEIIEIQGRLKGVEVVRRYADSLPDIQGSEGELRQVFLTIIGNALDAMGEKGTLSMETGGEGQGVFIKIADTGVGIGPEQLSRIFEPFFTTKSGQGGTGLGLSIARKIVTNHQGTIDVVSEKGSGTAVTVMLPLSRTGSK